MPRRPAPCVNHGAASAQVSDAVLPCPVFRLLAVVIKKLAQCLPPPTAIQDDVEGRSAQIGIARPDRCTCWRPSLGEPRNHARAHPLTWPPISTYRRFAVTRGRPDVLCVAQLDSWMTPLRSPGPQCDDTRGHQGEQASGRSARPERQKSAGPYRSADEAVGAVRILQEVLGVPARIPAPMLWKEHAVRVISPPRAGAPNIIGPEALRKVSTGYGAADIFDEPAHEAKRGIDETGRSPSPAADRSTA